MMKKEKEREVILEWVLVGGGGEWEKYVKE